MRSDLRKKSINIGLSSLFAAILGSLFNLVLVKTGVLNFDTTIFAGALVGGLPIQLIVINLLFVVAGILVYEFLNARFPKNDLEKFSLSVSNLMLGFCLAFGFFGYSKLYTLLLFAVLFALLLYIEYVNKTRFMYRFYRAYAALFILVWFLNYTLINTAGITFNKQEMIGVNILTIPVELYIFALTMLLSGIFVFEKLRAKTQH